MTNDPDRLVQRLIDGDLREHEAADALHCIADAPEARRLLVREHRMRNALDQMQAPAIPEAFAERTVEALQKEVLHAQGHHEAQPAKAQSLLRRPVGVWINAWITGWQLPSAQLARGLAVLLLCAATFVAGLYSHSTWIATEEDAPTYASTEAVTHPVGATQQGAPQVWARFVYPHEQATSVAVAGDFNDWEPQPLVPRTLADGRTVWTGLISMERGEHEYMYLIDDEEWVTDPYAVEQRDDGFGAQNAVLNL